MPPTRRRTLRCRGSGDGNGSCGGAPGSAGRAQGPGHRGGPSAAAAGQEAPRGAVAEFSTTVTGLLALADWLGRHGVERVAMEATGDYWKPVWAVLEERFELLLVNAQHVKQVPGRK